RICIAESDSRHSAEEAQAHAARQHQAPPVLRNQRLSFRPVPAIESSFRGGMRFTIFQDSRKGSRKVNQDRLAYTYGRDTLRLVVADGMGGHAGGEIAAQICVRLFIERFQQEAKPVLRNPLKFLQETML